jgi:hypothetical protein
MSNNLEIINPQRQMFQPVPVPSSIITPYNPDAGAIGRMGDKWRASDNRKIAENNRIASDNMLQIAENNDRFIVLSTTLSSRLATALMRDQHEQKMMALVEQKEERTVIQMDLQNQKTQLENMILSEQHREAKASADSAEMDLSARRQAMGL